MQATNCTRIAIAALMTTVALANVLTVAVPTAGAQTREIVLVPMAQAPMPVPRAEPRGPNHLRPP